MLNLLARAAAEVAAPLAGRAILFLAEDLAPYYKTSDGVVHALVGPQGIQGEKGDQGLQGVQGETGPQGVGVPSGGATGQFVQRTASGTQWAGALTPGQMGFAADSIQIANNISTLNDATQSGFYRAAAGSAGNPTATGAFLCIHMPSGGTATYGAQLGISEADGRIYQRLKTNGAWGGWIPNAFDTQVVHSTGAENIGGAKTFTGQAMFNGGLAVQSDQNVQLGAGGAGLRGNAAGAMVVGGNATTGASIILRPQLSVGAAGQVAVNSDGSMTFSSGQAATRASLGAVGLTGDESIAGIKTFTSNNAIRSLSVGAGFWLEAISATYGFLFNTDGSRFNLHFRSPNFGAQIMTALQVTDAGMRFGVPLTPFTANTQTVGSSTLPFNQFFAQNTTISTSDSRLKTEPRELREAEFKAASAIARLPAVWRWLNRVHGDENCEPEGKEARKHFGPTVQAAIAVMEGLGLDPFAYSFICYDEWEAEPERWHEWPAKEAVYETIPAVLDGEGEVVEPERTMLIEPAVEAGRELIQPAREAGNRYSFRREELLCFIVRALAQEIDGLSERVAELRLAGIEQRLMVLESRPAAEP